MPLAAPRWTETKITTAPGEKHGLVSTATMSNQTDGRRSAKNTATTREHLRPPPVTATGLLCRPQNTPHDPCKSLRSRGKSQSEPKTSPGSAFATLGGNDVQRQKQTSTPRTCISAFDNGHSLSTRPSLSIRYLEATQCNAIPSPPSAALSSHFTPTTRRPAKYRLSPSTVLDTHPSPRRPPLLLHASTAPSQALPSKATRQRARTRTDSHAGQHRLMVETRDDERETLAPALCLEALESGSSVPSPPHNPTPESALRGV